MTTYYIDYVGGSDSQNGLSKATAWKRHPYMTGFGGSYSHVAGDRFIFKGGVTWPRVCFQMKILQGGSSTSNRDYYGIDNTWYSGGSWTRPLFDFEFNLIGTWGGWHDAAGVLVYQCSFITFEGIEFARLRAPLSMNGVSNWGTVELCLYDSTYVTAYNCLFRDWDTPTVGGIVPDDASGGGGMMKVNSGYGHVADSCEFHCLNVSVKGGTCLWNVGEASNCYFHDISGNAFQYGQIFRNNIVHDMSDPTDQRAHANVAECPGGLICYNNLICRISGRAQIIFVAPGYYGNNSQDLIYNNIVYDVAQPCVVIDNDGNATSALYSSTKVYNNTLEGPDGTGWCVRVGVRADGPPVRIVDITNNHLITSGTDIQFSRAVTAYTASNNITQTPVQASSAGYTTSNNFKPTSSGSITVDAGLDLSSKGFSIDISGSTRPYGASWDVGAYEFTSGSGGGTITGSAGLITITQASSSYSENVGSITITCQRYNGTSGSVGVNYSTTNITAQSGINYTAVSGTLSWNHNDSSNKTFEIPILNSAMSSNKSFRTNISNPTGSTLGTFTSQNITLTGTALSGLMWEAENGTLTLPMTISNTGSIIYVGSTSYTVLPATPGIASYPFSIDTPGYYLVYAKVNTAGDGNNSVYIDIDNSNFVEPTTVWDIPVTGEGVWSMESSSWRGNGTYDNNQFVPKTWYLTSGSHTLYIGSREASAFFDHITMSYFAPASPIGTVKAVISNNFSPGKTRIVIKNSGNGIQGRISG